MAKEYQKINGQAVPINGTVKVSSQYLADLKAEVEKLKEEVNRISVYSSEEVPIGKWIDNKTIFRKVFTNITVSSAQMEFDTGIANIEAVVFVDLFNGANVHSGYWYSASNMLIVQYMPTKAGTFYFNCPTQYANGKFTLIVEYTKTED